MVRMEILLYLLISSTTKQDKKQQNDHTLSNIITFSVIKIPSLQRNPRNQAKMIGRSPHNIIPSDISDRISLIWWDCKLTNFFYLGLIEIYASGHFAENVVRSPGWESCGLGHCVAILLYFVEVNPKICVGFIDGLVLLVMVTKIIIPNNNNPLTILHQLLHNANLFFSNFLIALETLIMHAPDHNIATLGFHNFGQ